MNKGSFESVTRVLNDEERSRVFAEHIRQGFSSMPKKLPSIYFYDRRGSELFQEITSLPEYYLTRCEHEILELQAESIVEEALESLNQRSRGGVPIRLIELGAGDTSKLFPIIEEFLRRGVEIKYCAVDISESALNDLSNRVAGEFPGLSFQGVLGEYIEGLNHVVGQNDAPNFLFFLGSNIGNFGYAQKVEMLKKIRGSLDAGDCILLGMDKKKEIGVLMEAYYDSEGVTSAFNLNLLARINRELDADFNLENFSHHALYNPVSGAMESYLISEVEQEVSIGALDDSFVFQAFEAVYTECSHKYSERDIEDLAEKNGFTVAANYTDEREYFINTLWKT